MNVGQHTTSSDRDASKQLAQLLIIADCKLNVTGYDASLLVVTSSVTGQLQNLSCQIFQYCCLQFENSVRQLNFSRFYLGNVRSNTSSSAEH